MPSELKEITYRPVQTALISSLSREEGLRYALRMASAALCTGSPKPCGHCPACVKIARGSHPDVTILSRETDSKGNTKKEISVDQIRTLIREAYVMPNEADRRVLIIPEADTMNVSAQNAALKLFEEPPNNAMILLCAAAPSRLLPTVRSRCTDVNLNAPAEASDEKAAELAENYLKITADKDVKSLIEWCYKNEGMDANAFGAFLESTRGRIADMLCGRADKHGMTTAELLKTEQLVERCLEYRSVNGSVKLAFGLLMARSVEKEK